MRRESGALALQGRSKLYGMKGSVWHDRTNWLLSRKFSQVFAVFWVALDVTPCVTTPYTGKTTSSIPATSSQTDVISEGEEKKRVTQEVYSTSQTNQNQKTKKKRKEETLTEASPSLRQSLKSHNSVALTD